MQKGLSSHIGRRITKSINLILITLNCLLYMEHLLGLLIVGGGITSSIRF